MPGRSGPELAEELVKLHPEMRVLYMSGYADTAVIRHGVLRPNTAFIQKPFVSEDLNKKVREVLDG
jgi:FixJ family two-component response regulator